MGTIMWSMDPDTALEFYQRCIDMQLVTEEEKTEVLLELAKEGKMQSVTQTERTPRQIAKDMAKNFGDVLYFGPKEETDENQKGNS